MNLDRRRFLSLSAVAASPAVLPAQAAPRQTAEFGLDGSHFGLRPGSPEDQSRVFQRAIDESARTRAPLAIPPGVYRAGDLKLAPGSHLVGNRGATRLLLTQGASLISATAADHVTLSGLTLEGSGWGLPQRRGLVQLERCQALKIADCEIKGSSQNGLVCIGVSGELTDCLFTDTADTAVHALDSAGLIIARNRINASGNNGIRDLAVDARRRWRHRHRQ